MSDTLVAVRGPQPLVVALGAVLLVDLGGGLLAVAAGINTWAQAWGGQARLAAPLPMIVAQVLLVWLTLGSRPRVARVAAGLLALACLASLVSGFFDGGLADPRLGLGLHVVQGVLLLATGVLGGLAAGEAVRRWRRRASVG